MAACFWLSVSVLITYAICEGAYQLWNYNEAKISLDEYKTMKRISPDKWEPSWDANKIDYSPDGKHYHSESVYLRTFAELIRFKFYTAAEERSEKQKKLSGMWLDDIVNRTGNKDEKESKEEPEKPGVTSGRIDPRCISSSPLDAYAFATMRDIMDDAIARDLDRISQELKEVEEKVGQT